METKRAKVIMLPKEDKTAPIKIMQNKLCINSINSPAGFYQHLYFTTDDEIQEGDWFTNGKAVYYNKVQLDGYIGFKKIVATTDTSLTYKCISCGGIGIINDEPCRTCIGGTTGRIAQPSNAFVQKYCELGGIDEVDIEYETLGGRCDYRRSDGKWVKGVSRKQVEGKYEIRVLPPKIKIDSDNNIIIHAIKNSWSKDELFPLFIAIEEARDLYDEYPAVKDIIDSYDNL